MKGVDAWAREIPRGYCVPRREGWPFSTERSTLDLAPTPRILVHCQRQRLLLELQYHQQCMSLYQAFICLGPTPEMSTPLADGAAAAGLGHAQALTSMLYQALTASEALSGVYHVFRWQTNALFTMLGYAYSFPFSSSRATVRMSIRMAIAVVDSYRDVLTEARPVASLARVLARDLGDLANRFYTGSSWSSSGSSPSLQSSSMTVATQPQPPATAVDDASNAAPPVLDGASFSPPSGNQGSAMTTPAGVPQPPAVASHGELLDLFSLDMSSTQETGGRQHPNLEMMDVLWSPGMDPLWE